MLKALLTAVLATWIASVSASPAQPPASLTASAGGSQPTHMKLQAGADTVKVRAVYSPDIRPNPPQAFANDDEPDASGWRSYGMLLATLVLMGVIAVRRYKAGRP